MPPISPRFLILRLRHATAKELLFRLQQQLAWRLLLTRHDPARRLPQPAPLLLPPLHGTPRASAIPPDPSDPRSVWEAARLQEATALLHDGRADEALNLVLDWLRQNPFPRGPHYRSAMECGLRIPALVRCLQAASAPDQRRALARAVCDHADLVACRLSRHSSRGNHTVAEAAGLIWAGALFRHQLSGAAWLRTGVNLLNEELPHQILPDGGGAEQAPAYLRLILDCYHLCHCLLTINRLPAPRRRQPLLEAGERFLASLDTNLPGDSDDGHAAAPGLTPTRPHTSPPQDGLHVFPDTGLSIIRSAGTVLTFDHGPLGLPPLHGHGHADALSFTLTVEGTPFFVDPGTFRYLGAPKERTWLRSTRAHNTVTVDALDQADQATPFVWNRPYTVSEVLHRQENDTITLGATHDGYTRLRSPVRHHRTLLWAPPHLTIVDTFSGSGIHSYTLRIHLHPDVTCQKENLHWRLTHGQHSLRLDLDASPGRGLYAPAYGTLQTAPMLTSRKHGTPDAIHFTTSINLDAL